MNMPEPSKQPKPVVGSTAWLERIGGWLDTWAPHCGAPRAVFEGQFRVILREIFDEIERRAEANMMRRHKLEGMHYAALKDVRKELGAERSNQLWKRVEDYSCRGAYDELVREEIIDDVLGGLSHE